MNNLKKIVCIYLLMIISVFIMDKVHDNYIHINYIAFIIIETILIIFLVRLFKLNMNGIIIFFSLIFILMILLSLDIDNYYKYYINIGYTKYTSIYSEGILNTLIIANIPFLGVFQFLHKYKILEYKMYIITGYVFVIMIISLIINKIKFLREC